MAYGFKSNTNFSLTAKDNKVINLTENTFVIYKMISGSGMQFVYFDASKPEEVIDTAINFSETQPYTMFSDMVKSNQITEFASETEYQTKLAEVQAAIAVKEQADADAVTKAEEEQKEKDAKAKRGKIIAISAAALMLLAVFFITKNKNE